MLYGFRTTICIFSSFSDMFSACLQYSKYQPTIQCLCFSFFHSAPLQRKYFCLCFFHAKKAWPKKCTLYIFSVMPSYLQHSRNRKLLKYPLSADYSAFTSSGTENSATAL